TGDRGATPAPNQAETAQTELAAVKQELETQKQVRDFWSRAPQAAWNAVAQQAELEAVFKRDFSDLRTPQDVDRLLQTDSQRAAQLRGLAVALQVTNQQLAQVAQDVTQVDQLAFRQFADMEDAKFLKARPEFADPRRAPALQRATMQMLRDVGYS